MVPSERGNERLNSRPHFRYTLGNEQLRDGESPPWQPANQGGGLGRSVESQLDGLSRAVVETVRAPLLVLDDSLTIISANPAFFESYGLTPEEVLGEPFFEVAQGQWDDPEFRRLITALIPNRSEFREVQRPMGQLERSNRDLVEFAHAASRDLQEPLGVGVPIASIPTPPPPSWSWKMTLRCAGPCSRSWTEPASRWWKPEMVKLRSAC